MSRDTGTERVSVTVKSVNHRFLDIAFRIPHALSPAESKLKTVVHQRLVRGRVEISMTAESTKAPERDVVIDEALLLKLSVALGDARKRGLIAGDLTTSDLLRIPQVMEIRPKAAAPGEDTPDTLVALAEAALGDAIDAVTTMRETEGRFIGHDLDTRLTTLGGFVRDLRREAAEGQKQLETRLRDRLTMLPVDLQGDPVALAQEVVRFISRSDIDEELVRLEGHLDHWRALAAGAEPCGRKLDFLVQEMNREVNTVGSKADSLRATETVIAAKAELERIREQVQNVE